MINESIVEIKAVPCARTWLWSWQAFRRPVKWAQTLTWVNDRKGWGARTLFIIRGTLLCPITSLCPLDSAVTSCVSIITSCTWASLQSAVHTGTQTKCCIFFLCPSDSLFFFFLNSSNTMEPFSRDGYISSRSKTTRCSVDVWSQCATDLLVDHAVQAGMWI